MLISSWGVLYSIAAANIDTDIVFPNRLGVEMSTSWLKWGHPFASRIRWWSLANVPGFSVFQKILAHARIKWS